MPLVWVSCQKQICPWKKYILYFKGCSTTTSNITNIKSHLMHGVIIKWMLYQIKFQIPVNYLSTQYNQYQHTAIYESYESWTTLTGQYLIFIKMLMSAWHVCWVLVVKAGASFFLLKAVKAALCFALRQLVHCWKPNHEIFRSMMLIRNEQPSVTTENWGTYAFCLSYLPSEVITRLVEDLLSGSRLALFSSLSTPQQRYWALILFLSTWQGEDKCKVTAWGWFQVNVIHYLL